MEIKGNDNYDVGFTVNGTIVSLEGHPHDHNTLTNYSSNKHIDHSSVVITAGIGLSGGGDLTTNRTINFNIPELTVDMTPDGAADYMMTYDASAATHKKVMLNNRPGGAGGGGMTFTEKFTLLSDPITEGSWVTTVIPGCTPLSLIEILVRNDNTAMAKIGGAREVGSVNARHKKVDKDNAITLWVRTNALCEVQLYCEHNPTLQFYIIGEWM